MSVGDSCSRTTRRRETGAFAGRRGCGGTLNTRPEGHKRGALLAVAVGRESDGGANGGGRAAGGGETNASAYGLPNVCAHMRSDGQRGGREAGRGRIQTGMVTNATGASGVEGDTNIRVVEEGGAEGEGTNEGRGATCSLGGTAHTRTQGTGHIRKRARTSTNDAGGRRAHRCEAGGTFSLGGTRAEVHTLGVRPTDRTQTSYADIPHTLARADIRYGAQSMYCVHSCVYRHGSHATAV